MLRRKSNDILAQIVHMDPAVTPRDETKGGFHHMVTFDKKHSQSIQEKTAALVEELLLNEGYLKAELAVLAGVTLKEFNTYIERRTRDDTAPHWAVDLLRIFGE